MRLLKKKPKMDLPEAAGFVNRKEKSLESKESNPRLTWDRPFEFLLNVLGFNIGLGNIWRFSYLCYKNGGGAFIIPYVLVAVFCGLPLLFLEMALAQYAKKGFFGAWNIVPIMKGVAISGFVLTFYFMCYIMVVMSWILLYLAHCFTTAPLPWSKCDNNWNTNSCVLAVNPSLGSRNGTLLLTNLTDNCTTSTAEFWTNHVLQRTDGIHNLGSFTNWRMVICFLVSWILCYLCVFKGIKTSGKVAYFTVLFPYVILVVLLVRGVTLEGAMYGISYYITPRMERLADPQVWLDAGGQVLYTLGVSTPVIYALGSHNKFHTDCYKYAIINVIICCGTSFFIGFVLFSYIGHMAVVQGKNITEVAEGGPGLVFEVFPAGLTLLPVPQLWSAIFFFVLLLFAIDTSFGGIEGCSSLIEDYRPKWITRPGGKVCRLAVCVPPFILGFLALFDGGIYIFELLNMYGNSGICLLSLAFCEVVGMSWIYGVERFFLNVERMIGYRPNAFFKYCYLYFCPAIILGILIAFCFQYSPLKIGDYEYPTWANVLGWMLSISVVSGIPIVAVKKLMEGTGSLKQRWKYATESRIDECARADENTSSVLGELPQQSTNLELI